MVMGDGTVRDSVGVGGYIIAGQPEVPRVGSVRSRQQVQFNLARTSTYSDVTAVRLNGPYFIRRN